MASPRSSGNRFRSSRETLPFMAIVVLGVAATTMICLLAVAGKPQGRREIVSDDFTKPRPTPTPRHTGITGGIMARERLPVPAPSPQKHYRLAAPSSPNAAPLSAADDIQQLGVTLWRLRPARKTDTAQRLLVMENNKSSEWIPERIEMDTPLRAGDRLRLSIESPREGYLYVVHRDLSTGGKLGQGILLFPRNLRGDDNRARPGKLIDLPGEDDDPGYFTVKASPTDQADETLTIIVSTTPLDLSVGEQPLRISAADLIKWEEAWGSETERFELLGGAGRAWTKEEKEAASPNGSRQLTQDEPAPQTIYRIAATNRTAFLLNVRITY